MNRDITANYIHYIQTGTPKTFRADIHIAQGCNFACIMCDNWKSEIQLNFSKDELYKMILTLKLQYHCTYIRLHGQEPTLYPHLVEIIRFAHACGIYVGIKTNGWLLNQIKIEDLIRAGLNEIYLSIDGSTPEIHDLIRGKNGSLKKNIEIMQKIRERDQTLPIYINSVVMINNLDDLKNMVSFGKLYQVNRVSFVFLNKKNKKEIHDLQLNQESFLDFFAQTIPEILDLAEVHKIAIDFSPFISSLVGRENAYIAHELRYNFDIYREEILEMQRGNYGKYFYDRYGCFGPYDHASINHNGDMFGCCVVERNRHIAVGNVKESSIATLWKGEKYEQYRKNANVSCGYSQLCGSNFWNRKKLFLDIYNTNLYDKSIPYNYYRFLKERFQNQKTHPQLWETIRSLLLFYYDRCIPYRELLESSGMTRNHIQSINNEETYQQIPILSKEFLERHREAFNQLRGERNDYTVGITSGSTGKRFSFTHPLNFRRHVQQIALFSEMSGFTFRDSYFSLTPINCNTDTTSHLTTSLPEYVKKIPIHLYGFTFSSSEAQQIQDIFVTHNKVEYIYSEPTYLLYLVLLCEKYQIPLPTFKGIFLAYSPVTRGMLNFLKTYFACPISITYGCSEVGPLAGTRGDTYQQISDSTYIEIIDNEIVITDFTNLFTPFIRYKNGDIGKKVEGGFRILGRKKEQEHGISFDEFDSHLYQQYPEIYMYQYNIGTKEFLYYSRSPIEDRSLLSFLRTYISGDITLMRLREDDFFYSGPCSKFKTIILGNGL